MRGFPGSSTENALCMLRVHRGGSSGSMLQRHSNGCLSELLPRPSADMIQASRRSVAAGSQAASFRRGAVVTASSARPELQSRPVPKIVITATPSCTGDELTIEHDASTSSERLDRKTSDKKKNRKSSRDFSRKKKGSKQSSRLDADAAGASGSKETPTADGGAPKKEKRKSSFLGLFDGDGAGGDRRLSLQIAARFAKLHIISQLRSLNKEKKAAKTVGIIVSCFTGVLRRRPYVTSFVVRCDLDLDRPLTRSTGHRRLFRHVLGSVLHRLPHRSVLSQLHVSGCIPRLFLARLLQLGRQPVHLRTLLARLPLRVYQLSALRVRAHAQRAGEPGQRPDDGSAADDDDADRSSHCHRRRVQQRR